jgi:hypothetical protein
MTRNWLVGIALLLLGCGAVAAHPMPNSVVTLDVGEHAITGEIVIPLIELDLALGTDFSSDSAAKLPAGEMQLREYLADHLSLAAPDGAPWTVSVGKIAVGEETGAAAEPYAELLANVALTPPANAPVRQFTLTYDAVMHQVATHYALVDLGDDWLSGQIDETGQAAVSLGVIRVNPVDGTMSPLVVDLAQGSYWQGFLAMLGLGASHIAQGTDHLLFLLTLLLPLPLVAAGSHWRSQSGTKTTLISVLKIVTAFTLGHSLTLILASLFRLNLPQQPIEVFVALTILVSAIHALRPIFPKHEPVLAGVFGLVHGMAFSFTLAELNLSTAQLVVSLLGFNLGIELFQLLIVALILPSFLLFARSGAYGPVRFGGALVAIVAALGWLADRLGFSSAPAVFVDGIGRQLPLAIAALTFVSLAVWAGGRLRKQIA